MIIDVHGKGASHGVAYHVIKVVSKTICLSSKGNLYLLKKFGYMLRPLTPGPDPDCRLTRLI